MNRIHLKQTAYWKLRPSAQNPPPLIPVIRTSLLILLSRLLHCLRRCLPIRQSKQFNNIKLALCCSIRHPTANKTRLIIHLRAKRFFWIMLSVDIANTVVVDMSFFNRYVRVVT